MENIRYNKKNGITILTKVSIEILLEISEPAMYNPHQRSGSAVGCTEVLAAYVGKVSNFYGTDIIQIMHATAYLRNFNQ